MGLMPCKDFLTSSTAPEPPNQGKCCDGLRSLVQDAPICLCRILEGTDLDKLMSATVDREKFIRTMIICDSSPGEFGSCEGNLLLSSSLGTIYKLFFILRISECASSSLM